MRAELNSPSVNEFKTAHSQLEKRYIDYIYVSLMFISKPLACFSLEK